MGGSEASSAEREPVTFPGLSDVRHLGAGGMGSVYRAWQEDLGRPVAVKALRVDLADRAAGRELFASEARILAQLDHPGIVPVHFTGETERGPYYVMRLVEGVPVDEHLRGASAFEVARVFERIADALAAAHAAGVLHRDVKPANVLVEPDGRPILVDFGLSTRVVPGETEGRTGALVGTPDYLAPELLAGAAYSPASDVYALGATLYTVLTGRVPFEGGDLGEKLRAIREDDPPALRALRPDVPKPLQAICLKAMERAPGDRYPSAAELREDLRRFGNGDPVEADPVRSRSLLRRKLEQHLADHAEWEELGLLDARQRAALQYAYESLDEEQRGLLRGAVASVPNLLLLTGLVLTVFGPLLLLLVAWNGLAPPGRVALPAVPAGLLLALGLRRWRAEDRRRGVACLAGAALLSVPAAFALADLVPALRSVVDDAGQVHPVLGGELWLPPADAPAWVQAGARLLEWKVLATAALVLLVVSGLFRVTRAAFFLWPLGLALAAALVSGAQLLGWQHLPLWTRWLLECSGAVGVIGAGLPLDRRWRRDRALPFYGLGFVWLVLATMRYAHDGVPASLVGLRAEPLGAHVSLLLHGAAVLAAGLLLHRRGTALLRTAAGVPLLFGFLFTFLALSGLGMEKRWGWQLALVAACVGFLLLALSLHRRGLVLVSAITLPLSIGMVSQQHFEAVWAWSLTIVLVGLALVLLGFRAPRSREEPAARGGADPGSGGGRRGAAPE